MSRHPSHHQIYRPNHNKVIELITRQTSVESWSWTVFLRTTTASPQPPSTPCVHRRTRRSKFNGSLIEPGGSLSIPSRLSMQGRPHRQRPICLASLPPFSSCLHASIPLSSVSDIYFLAGKDMLVLGTFTFTTMFQYPIFHNTHPHCGLFLPKCCI